MSSNLTHPYIVRTLIDGQADDTFISKNYPNIALSLFDSTVSRYTREGVEVETTVQLIQRGEIQYETTIPATVPDVDETNVEVPEHEVSELVLKAVSEGLFVPMSQMGSDERETTCWAVSVLSPESTGGSMVVTFDDQKRADMMADLFALNSTLCVSRWVAVAGPEYLVNPLVSGWRQVSYFV